MKRKCLDESLCSPSKSRRLDCDVLEEPSSNNGVFSAEERALVLYDPANTPFLISPTSPDFASILNSDLIPGLRGKSNKNKLLTTSKITKASNNSLSVVPWVTSQFDQVSVSRPMEEGAEMMDTDDVSSSIDISV